MSSGFFMLPGVNPRAWAFIFISGMPIRFSATFVEAILLSPLIIFSRGPNSAHIISATFTISVCQSSSSPGRTDFYVVRATQATTISSMILRVSPQKKRRFSAFFPRSGRFRLFSLFFWDASSRRCELKSRGRSILPAAFLEPRGTFGLCSGLK